MHTTVIRAADLREDAALRAMTIGIAQQYSASSEADIMSAIDSGVEAARGKGERVWILDPIDGTKGFMTNQNYIIGLALVVDGEPIVAALANPRLEQHDVPSIMVAVKDKGLRYWPASGAGPIPARLTPALQEKKVSWLVKMESLAKFRGPTRSLPHQASPCTTPCITHTSFALYYTMHYAHHPLHHALRNELPPQLPSVCIEKNL